jgi:hypothetical protein
MKEAMMHISSASLPVDRRIPLAVLLDADLMAARLDALADPARGRLTGCRIAHVRYRPGESCVVLYDVDVDTPDGPVTAMLHAVCEPTGNGARASAPADGAGGVLLAGARTLDDLGVVVREFPDDPRLPGMTAARDRDTLAGALSAVLDDGAARMEFTGLGRNLRLIRYKPGARLIMRCRTRWLDRHTGERVSERCLLRFDRAAVHPRREALQSLLEDAADAGFMVPRLLFRAPGLGCSGSAWVEGESLSRALRDDDRREDALAAAAAVLAGLHRLPGADLPGLSIDDRLLDMTERRQRLAGYPPVLRERLDRLREQLQLLAASTAPGPVGVTHGDFHQGQLLLTDGAPCLLDLDRVHRGETLADVGAFVAQLEVMRMRGRLADGDALGSRFVAAYERAVGVTIDSRRLRLWAGASLAAAATKELRRLRPDWRRRADDLAARALDIVAGVLT